MEVLALGLGVSLTLAVVKAAASDEDGLDVDCDGGCFRDNASSVDASRCPSEMDGDL